jgi:chemotaxis protein MotB
VSAAGHNNRRRRGDHAHEEHADERWLLTYSDMITLLMALFIVMWAMSSVNISKFEELKKSLQNAFSGQILAGSPSVLTGETAIIDDGSPKNASNAAAAADDPTGRSSLFQEITEQIRDEQRAAETESLREAQEAIERYALQNHIEDVVQTTIDERGLVIRLLTDRVLFDSGQAVLKADSAPLLDHVATIVEKREIATNAVRVEGNTDSHPIATAQFPSNWELSAARAAAVLQRLRRHGVADARLSLAGYADRHPIAPNDTPGGRARNRRVEVVVLRRFQEDN